MDSPWVIPRSSLVASRTWLETLRSNRVMLSRSSSLLLPPPTSARHFAVSQGRRLSTSWLPGTEGWRPAALCLPASRRISPVPGTTFWPFRAPCAGRLLDTRSKIPGVARGLRPLGKGSTPPRHHNMNLLVVMAPKLLDAPPDLRVGGHRSGGVRRPKASPSDTTEPWTSLRFSGLTVLTRSPRR